MAIIRKKELRAMGTEEMKAKLAELRKELLSARAKIATTKTSDNPGKYKQIKKTIARIRTFVHQRGVKLD